MRCVRRVLSPSAQPYPEWPDVRHEPRQTCRRSAPYWSFARHRLIKHVQPWIQCIWLFLFVMIFSLLTFTTYFLDQVLHLLHICRRLIVDQMQFGNTAHLVPDLAGQIFTDIHVPFLQMLKNGIFVPPGRINTEVYLGYQKIGSYLYLGYCNKRITRLVAFLNNPAEIPLDNGTQSLGSNAHNNMKFLVIIPRSVHPQGCGALPQPHSSQSNHPL